MPVGGAGACFCLISSLYFWIFVALGMVHKLNWCILGAVQDNKCAIASYHYRETSDR